MSEVWKAKARQAVLGERKELRTLPGFWLQARKFGVTGADRIRAAEGLPPSLLRKLARLRPDGDQDVTEDKEFQRKAVDALTDEEFGILQEKQQSLEPKIVKERLLYGIGKHNLGGEGPEHGSEVVTEDFVAELLEFLGTDTIQEMLDAIEEMNPGPFQSGKSDASSSSPNGSSKDPPMRLVGTSRTMPSGETASGETTQSALKS